MQRVKRIIEWTMKCMGKVSRDRVDVYSAQSAFFTLMGLIPFLMLIMIWIQYTPLTEKDMLGLVEAMFPDTVHTFIIGIINSVYTKSSGLISASVVAAVWACSKAMLSITNGLNTIYETNITRNYFIARFRAAIYIVFLLISILLAAALFVFGNIIHDFLISSFPFLKSISNLIVIFRNMATIVLLTLVFCTMFTYLPYSRRVFSEQLPGAAASAVSWSLFSYIFSIYIHFATRMSTIYGSLTTVVMMMLWLYFCMWLLFMGAEINRYLENPLSFS